MHYGQWYNLNQHQHPPEKPCLMNKAGEWSLAPALDLTYSYNPSGTWTAHHQMTLNGKRNENRIDYLRRAYRRAGYCLVFPCGDFPGRGSTGTGRGPPGEVSGLAELCL